MGLSYDRSIDHNDNQRIHENHSTCRTPSSKPIATPMTVTLHPRAAHRACDKLLTQRALHASSDSGDGTSSASTYPLVYIIRWARWWRHIHPDICYPMITQLLEIKLSRVDHTLITDELSHWFLKNKIMMNRMGKANRSG